MIDNNKVRDISEKINEILIFHYGEDLTPSNVIDFLHVITMYKVSTIKSLSEVFDDKKIKDVREELNKLENFIFTCLNSKDFMDILDTLRDKK